MLDTTSTKEKSDRQNKPLYKVNDFLSLLVRICLSTIFLWSGINKIMSPIATQENMSAHGMPFTSLFLAGAITLEILGGLSVLLGI